MRVTHERAFELWCRCGTRHVFLARVTAPDELLDTSVPRCWRGEPLKLLAYGGRTRVDILRVDDAAFAAVLGGRVPTVKVVGEGTARCHPRDHFTRRVGLDVALGRALLAAGLA